MFGLAQCVPCEFVMDEWLAALFYEGRQNGNKACLVFSSQNNSISPSESLRTASEKHRSSSDYSLDSKKRKVEEKDSMSRYVSREYHPRVCYEAAATV